MRSHTPWKLVVSSCIAALAAPGCAGRPRPPQPLTLAAAQLELSDAAVEEAVERELGTQPAIPRGLVDVRTSQGVVTLAGTVPNLLVKEQAVREAEAVRGVRAVVNLLEVEPERRPDELLEVDLREALARDPVTADEHIHVQVSDGEAVLSGVVDSHGERELARQVASSVAGLRAVREELALERAEARRDGDIREEIVARVRWDALVNGALVRVEVRDGEVALRGTLGSLVEKRRLERLAWVPGVHAVNVADVEVAWWARDPGRGSMPTQLDDREVEAAVRAALWQDPRVRASTPIDVHSFAGKVVLSGSVGSLSEREAAERAAEATLGVSDVENHLRVRATSENPDETRERIERAIERHPYVRGARIDVAIENGVAVLRGRVRSSFERSVAEQVAAREPGVLRVDNQLSAEKVEPLTLYDPYSFMLHTSAKPRARVGSSAERYLPDVEIAKRIRRELLWSPLVDATQIEVEVRGAVAILSGVVASRAEMLAAINNALQGGALEVDNRLITSP